MLTRAPNRVGYRAAEGPRFQRSAIGATAVDPSDVLSRWSASADIAELSDVASVRRTTAARPNCPNGVHELSKACKPDLRTRPVQRLLVDTRVRQPSNDGALCDVRTPRRQRCSRKPSCTHR